MCKLILWLWCTISFLNTAIELILVQLASFLDKREMGNELELDVYPHHNNSKRAIIKLFTNGQNLANVKQLMSISLIDIAY